MSPATLQKADKEKLEELRKKRQSGSLQDWEQSHLNYLEGNRNKKSKGRHKEQVFIDAQKKVRKWRKTYMGTEIAQAIGTNKSSIYFLEGGHFEKVSREMAELIGNYTGEIDTERKIISEEIHQEAVDIVRELYEAEGNMVRLAEKIGTQSYYLWPMYNDEYSNPHPVARKILNYHIN